MELLILENYPILYPWFNIVNATPAVMRKTIFMQNHNIFKNKSICNCFPINEFNDIFTAFYKYFFKVF